MEKFQKLFSENGKVVCLGYKNRLIKQIPLIRKIPTKKEESVENFLERMEKVGEDGLTKYERYFAKIKKDNEQYRQILFLASYKSPTSEPSNKPTVCKKYKLKFSSYINSYLKFLKDFDEDPEVRRMTIERSIRKIIGAEPIHKIGHMPRIELVKGEIFEDGCARKGDKVIGINIIFHYKDDSNLLISLLDDKKCSYIKIVAENKHIIFISEEYANKFIKNTLQIKIDSIEQLDKTTQGYSRSG